MSDSTTVLSMSVYASTSQATLHTSLQNDSASSAATQKEESTGDTVSISEAAQALSKGLVTSAATQSADAVAGSEESSSGGLSLDDGEEEESSSNTTVESLKQQIESLEEQIDEIKEDETLTDQEKNTQVMALQTQKAQLEMQLQEATSEDSFDSSGMTASGTYGASS